MWTQIWNFFQAEHGRDWYLLSFLKSHKEDADSDNGDNGANDFFCADFFFEHYDCRRNNEDGNDGHNG